MIGRRHFLASTAGLLTASCTMGALGNAGGGKDQPNIVMIAIDDLNDWIGALGGHPGALTPNIDRLAARGALFTNAHANAPICGPSRASLMTGMLPSTTGIYGHIEDNDIRDLTPALEGVEFLPEYLRRAGYHTMGIGKLFHKGAPTDVFDEFGGRYAGFGPKPEKAFHYSAEGTSTDWGPFPSSDEEMPDTASAKWAAERLERSYDRPFLLATGFLRPHVPWYVPQHWFDLHPIEDIVLPPYLEDDITDVPQRGRAITNLPAMPTMQWMMEKGQWREAIRGYLACISFVDHCVGTVLNALDASPHRDNTVVVLFSDHGYHLGEKDLFQKFTLWERSTRIPLIFAGAGIKPGTQIDWPASLLDVYPTLASFTKLPAPQNAQGTNLAPLLKGRDSGENHLAITTYGIGNHSVRDRRYRLIRYADGSLELYDHASDPNEWHNVADDPAYRAIVEKLSKELPQQNAPWDPKTEINLSPYFEQSSNRVLPGSR